MKIPAIITRSVMALAMTAGAFFPASAETTPDHDPLLVLTGDSFVTVVRYSKIPAGGSYLKGLVWEWDARTSATMMGLTSSNMTHVDEAKFVDNNTKVLVTSSAHWAALVDYATRKPVFYTSQCKNAHSAEMLPDNKVVIACSESSGELQVYDINKSNTILFRTPLANGHGAVWIESRQRLYANGGQKLNIYKLVNWDTDAPELELEQSIKTPKAGTHDLSLVDDNTLCISGRGCYFFDIDTQEFTELPFFSSDTAIKSTNYNAATGEMWYTNSTSPEGDYSWSTQTVHHTYDPANGPDHCTFRTDGFNLYKVRVLEWDNAEAGITSATADKNTDGNTEWFNMQGIRVENPDNGLYIRRQGNSVSKIALP